MKAEDRFVERLTRMLSHPASVVVGPGDDAAVVRTEGDALVATTDLLVEGVDFFSSASPEGIGRRCLAVNLSDLAAMGAHPSFFLLSIGFPANKGEDFPLAVTRGALSRADPFGALLVGGDLSRAPVTILSAALWGRPEGRPLLRSGGRAGDDLYLSGWPGRAAAGRILAGDPVAGSEREGSEGQRELLAAYHDPEPRIALGLSLARAGLASAAIDVSDGLGADAARLARASSVEAVIEEERLPVARSLASFAEMRKESPLEWILSGGDDYELLFSAPASARDTLENGNADWGTPVTRVGFLREGRGAILRGRRGDRDISDAGFDHFERNR